MDISLIARGGVPVELDRERILWFSMDTTWLLVQRYGMTFWRELLTPPTEEGGASTLKSMDTLQYFLWAGLLEDAKRNGETLTLERVADFINPFTVQTLVSSLSIALTVQNFTPEGKAPAAKASPASPSRTRASTSSKRVASPSPSSTGRRKRSGKRR